MKLLAIHTSNNPDKYIHQVDTWRVWRPLREIRRHVDWDVTERPTIMKFIERYKSEKDFTEEELEKTVEDLKSYDMIFGSYTAFLNGMVFALCLMVAEKYGVKLVIDVDDNMFAIKEDNIGWWRAMDHEQTWDLQTVILKAPYLTCTNERLAQELRKRREQAPDTVKVVPNYITYDYKQGKRREHLTIGYFGGVSHYNDLHDTGVIKAIERIMHENREVRCESVGMEITGYLPRQRYKYVNGQRGHAWIKSLFPTLNYDIAIAPLTDDEFNETKSDIKWQEATRMGAAFVGSKVRPYVDTIKPEVDGLLVDNTEASWYEALNKLVKDTTLRQKLVENASKRLDRDFMIESKWTVLKEALEGINADTTH